MTRVLTYPSVIFAAFAGLVIMTQWGALGREVIDWDESTFILLAGRLLEGHLPYVDLFDNKPPVMFFMLAGVMAVFGENLFSVRLFGDATLLITAFMIFKICQRLSATLPASIAGVAFIAICALPFGQHTSTELPAIMFITSALWLLLQKRNHHVALFCAGLLIAMAVLTRSNLGAVAVFVGLYLLIEGLFLRHAGTYRWAVIPYTLGGLSPLAAFLGLYWLNNSLDVFILSTVTVPFAYAAEQYTLTEALVRHGQAWQDYLLRFPIWVGLFSLCIGAGTVAALRRITDLRVEARYDVTLICCTAFSAILSVLMSGAAYPHYWIQILPFACFLFVPLFMWLSHSTLMLGLGIILVLIMLGSALLSTGPNFARLALKPNFFEERWKIQDAAEAITTVLTPEDQIWALDHHLIHWYLKVPPMSPLIAHPSNITRASIVQPLTEAGYIEHDVLQQQYDSRPTFIVMGTGKMPFYLSDTTYLESFLRDHYVEFYRNDLTTVFRKTAPAQSMGGTE